MISLITCTGDRHEAFAMCERYVERSPLSPDLLEWIVVDDGEVPTVCTMSQQYIRREPCGDPKQSFRDNLSAALSAARGDAIVVIEDDDWYREDHIARMVTPILSGQASLAGEAFAIYYNLPARKFRYCGNRQHASLCQTAFHRKWIPWILGNTSGTFVDMQLWRHVTGREPVHLYPQSESCIGLKGWPGRKGIGMGHRPERGRWADDPDGSALVRWIREDDAREVLECVAC